MAVADILPLGMIDQLQKLHHVIKIIKRLANAHHHNAANTLTAILGGGDHLPQQLTHREIAHLAADGRGTEFASHCTPNLRGDANRGAVLIVHQHALNTVPIGKLKQIFYSAVNGGNKLFPHTRQVIKGDLCKPLLRHLTDISHLLGRDAAMQLRKDLPRTVARLTKLPQQCLQLLLVKRKQFLFFFHITFTPAGASAQRKIRRCHACRAPRSAYPHRQHLPPTMPQAKSHCACAKMPLPAPRFPKATACR